MNIKAVRNLGSGELISAYWDTPSATYVPGMWTHTHPKMAAIGYYLFFYNDLVYAREEFDTNPNIEFWECEVRGIQPVPSCWLKDTSIKDYMAGIEEHPEIISPKLRFDPVGHFCAESIKLIRRIE